MNFSLDDIIQSSMLIARSAFGKEDGYGLKFNHEDDV